MRTKSFIKLIFIALLSISLTACSTYKAPPSKGSFKVGKPYSVAGKRYTPRETYSFTETGIASWYGPGFDGKHTANGEIYDQKSITAAHRTLQMPSIIRVTNLENGRSIIVRVNDRGPFSRGRVMDLSERAADLLKFKNKGTARVKLQLMPNESRVVADAAKNGEDIRGVEIALNQGKTIEEALGRVAPITTASLETPVDLMPASVPTVESAELPAVAAPPVRSTAMYKQFPVKPTSIFVQAGSFASEANAIALAAQLKSIGNANVYPAIVRNQQFYRVRLGPIATVDKADQTLASVVSSGQTNAIIVVDEQ